MGWTTEKPDWLVAALKAHTCKALDGGVFRTCPARLSYPSLFEPQADKEDPKKKPKYGLSLLFPAYADITLLRTAHEKMQAEKFNGHKGKLYKPFRDQGEKGHISGYEEGAIFISARTESKPQLRKAVAGKLVPIQDPAEVYPGMWVLATVHLFPFDAPQQKGVSFGLNNVLKIRDDESFGGGATDPDVEFEAVDLNEAGVNVDDLL